MLVVVNDYVRNKRMSLYYSEDDLQMAMKSWEAEDQVLVHLQAHPMFAGRRRWCDLEPHHYRLMVTKSISMVGELSDEERLDHTNPVVLSNNFLLCALAICLNKRMDGMIEVLRLSRISDIDVSFEYSAILNQDIPDSASPSKPELTVIHTKKDPK